MARRRRHQPPPAAGLSPWGILQRRWAWGLLACLSTLVPAVSLIAFLPEVYRSTATILIERQQIPDELVRSTVTSALETRLHTITQEILSRPLLEGLAERFTLSEEAGENASADQVLAHIRRSIEVELEASKVGRDYSSAAVAFTVSYGSRDPEKAALVANSLAQSYVEKNLEMRTQEAAGTADFLRDQLEATRRELEEHEKRVSAFKERHSGQLPEQLPANLSTLEQLNVQLRLNSENQISASERRAALVRQLNEAEGMSPTVGPEGAGSRLLQLRQTLSALQARYSDKYPDVVRVKAEIESLEAELRRTADGSTKADETLPETNPLTFQLRRSIDEVDVELRRLRAEQENLRGSLGVYQQRVEMAPRREQESQALMRDYETTKELYRVLVTRERESQLAQDMEQRKKGEQFRVIEPAIPSGQPSAPNRRRLIPLTLPLSIGLGVAVMILLELLDKSLRSAEELQALTRIPVVVSIPPIVVEADRRERKRRLVLAAGAGVLGTAGAVGLSYVVASGNWALTHLFLRLS
jgi:polysaccharide biosynthesis transport protein